MQKVFEALASAPRRKILAFLAEAELNAGEMIFTGPGDAHDIRATADATVLITVSAQADDFRPGESRSAAS